MDKIKVGVVGLGFMGRRHVREYQANCKAKVVAVCDIDKGRFEGSGAAGNIPGDEPPLDLSGIKTFQDFDEMLAKAELDALSITLPTYLHPEFTVKALEHGLHVLCEKPMALRVEECNLMIAAAQKSGKLLQIAHCIRLWPWYVKAKEIIDSGNFGKVIAASFRRLSATPTWSWQNWLMDFTKSGGAIFDLHIHDADFVLWLFGVPFAVTTYGAKGPSDGFDHVHTQYKYDDVQVVTAEGGWIMPPSFGFEMSFNIVLERATIICDSTRIPAFKVCTNSSKEPIIPGIAPGDGYSIEIDHFLKKVMGEQVPDLLSPTQARRAVALIGHEINSARAGYPAIFYHL